MIYEVWQEGYDRAGQMGKAQLLGKYVGDTFDEAVEKMLLAYPHKRLWHDRIIRTINGWTKVEHCVWEMRLYDNEKQARKWFG